MMEVTLREAALLAKMRFYPFGKFTVHKIENRIVRIEVFKSELIEEEDGEERVARSL